MSMNILFLALLLIVHIDSSCMWMTESHISRPNTPCIPLTASAPTQVAIAALNKTNDVKVACEPTPEERQRAQQVLSIHQAIKKLSPNFPINKFNFLVKREIQNLEYDPSEPTVLTVETQWAVAVNSCIPFFAQKNITEKQLKVQIKKQLDPIQEKLHRQVKDEATFLIIKQMYAMLKQEQTDEVQQFLQQPVTIEANQFKLNLTDLWAVVDAQRQSDSCCVIS